MSVASPTGRVNGAASLRSSESEFEVRSFAGVYCCAWSDALEIHLIDGTYELFRHYYAVPAARDRNGLNVAAVRGVLNSILGMINRGATHIGVATDHVIESFRNGLWPDYKTGAGIEPDLLSQFGPLEDALRALGVVVWPMMEYEADDAMAALPTRCWFRLLVGASARLSERARRT